MRANSPRLPNTCAAELVEKQPEPQDPAEEAVEDSRQATRDKKPLLVTKARMDSTYTDQVLDFLAELPGGHGDDVLAAQAKAGQSNNTCDSVSELFENKNTLEVRKALRDGPMGEVDPQEPPRKKIKGKTATGKGRGKGKKATKPKPVDAVDPSENAANPKPVDAVDPTQNAANPEPMDAVDPSQNAANPKPMDAVDPSQNAANPKPMDAVEPSPGQDAVAANPDGAEPCTGTGNAVVEHARRWSEIASRLHQNLKKGVYECQVDGSKCWVMHSSSADLNCVSIYIIL